MLGDQVNKCKLGMLDMLQEEVPSGEMSPQEILEDAEGRPCSDGIWYLVPPSLNHK